MTISTKLISWNVNGLRACIRKECFLEFVAQEQPAMLCLQEIKAEADQVNLVLPGYSQFWNSAEKKGYSGTLVLTKDEPLSVRLGMDHPKHDKEGRMITLEYDGYFLVNVYTPNAQNGLKRLEYRTAEWDVDFLAYLNKLQQTKPVIFCGDLNVSHKEIDLARPKDNVRNAGFTPQERAGFDNILAAGFLDTFREFTTEGGHYTWWSNRAGARERNVGWRLDYFCCSPALRPALIRSTILPQVFGSDHCPILLELG